MSSFKKVSNNKLTTLQMHDPIDQQQQQQRHVDDNCSATTQWGCDKDNSSKIKGDGNEQNFTKNIASFSSYHYYYQNNKNMATTATSYHQHQLPSFYSPTTTSEMTTMTTSSSPLLKRTNNTSSNNKTTTITKPGFPYNKKERTTYVGRGGSSYISFPLAKQGNNIPTTTRKSSSPTSTHSVTNAPPKAITTPTSNKNDNAATQRQHKPFRCNECGQTFSRSHNLKSHSATHSLVRPYKCDTCTREFRRLHDLKRHQKLHTGERPYVCSTCDRSFSRLDALNRHLRAEIGCDRSKKLNIQQQQQNNKEKSSSVQKQQEDDNTESNEPRRFSAPTLPCLEEERQKKRTPLLPPILFSSFDSFFPSSTSTSSSSPQKPLLNIPSPSSLSLSPPPTIIHSSLDYKTEADQLKRQIHDLQVENRLLRSLVVDNNNNKQSDRHDNKTHKRQSSAEEIRVSPTPMDWA